VLISIIHTRSMNHGRERAIICQRLASAPPPRRAICRRHIGLRISHAPQWTQRLWCNVCIHLQHALQGHWGISAAVPVHLGIIGGATKLWRLLRTTPSWYRLGTDSDSVQTQTRYRLRLGTDSDSVQTRYRLGTNSVQTHGR
jgi:hypothetical protein